MQPKCKLYYVRVDWRTFRVNLTMTNNNDHCNLVLERFSNDCWKTKTKAITPSNHNRNDQLQFLAIIYNSPKAREKSRIHGAIGFGFASHWLKNWRDSLKPITKHSNRNHVITFDKHLKTALIAHDKFISQE